MTTAILLLMLAFMNLPPMIDNKKNWYNFLAFGWCLGLSACKFLEYFTN